MRFLGSYLARAGRSSTCGTGATTKDRAVADFFRCIASNGSLAGELDERDNDSRPEHYFRAGNHRETFNASDSVDRERPEASDVRLPARYGHKDSTACRRCFGGKAFGIVSCQGVRLNVCQFILRAEGQGTWCLYSFGDFRHFREISQIFRRARAHRGLRYALSPNENNGKR